MARLRTFLFLVLTGVVLVTALGFLGGLHWSFDLFSHFRVQYAALALLLLVGTLLHDERRKSWVLVCTLAFVLNFVPLWPYLFDEPVGGESDAPSIHVLSWNTWRTNVDWGEIETVVRGGSYDIVVLLETSHAVREKAAALSDLYQSWVSGEFVVLISPQLSPKVLAKADDGREAEPVAGGFVVHLTVESHPVALLALHLSMPIYPDSAQRRLTQLSEIARWSNSQRSAHLVIGDLNMTPWSAGFRELMDRTDLRNTMIGFGVQGSWPFHNDLVSLFRIPLDHCLVSPGLFASECSTGRSGSSNHRPLEVTLRCSVQ